MNGSNFPGKSTININDVSKSYDQLLTENRELVLMLADYYAKDKNLKIEQAVIEIRRMLAEKMKKWNSQ